jgi:FkbM family methyltransferase
MANLAARLYTPWLRFYRRFLKRFRPVHNVAYFLGNGFLSLASRVIGFRTNEADPLSWRLALITGSHESASRTLFARIVRPGMTVVDIGAHIGYYTTQFSRLVGSSGRVIAFEPHPLNYEILKRNVARRHNVTLMKNAASDRAETVTLFDDMPDTGGPSLRRDDHRADQVKSLSSARELAPRAAGSQPRGRFEIAAVRVDDALTSLGVDNVDVVKMDIEGAEMGALLGMEGVLRTCAALHIVLELYPAAMKPFNVEPLGLWSWLIEQGFEVSRIADDGNLEALGDEASARELIDDLERAGSETNLLASRSAFPG